MTHFFASFTSDLPSGDMTKSLVGGFLANTLSDLHGGHVHFLMDMIDARHPSAVSKLPILDVTANRALGRTEVVTTHQQFLLLGTFDTLSWRGVMTMSDETETIDDVSNLLPASFNNLKLHLRSSNENWLEISPLTLFIGLQNEEYRRYFLKLRRSQDHHVIWHVRACRKTLIEESKEIDDILREIGKREKGYY